MKPIRSFLHHPPLRKPHAMIMNLDVDTDGVFALEVSQAVRKVLEGPAGEALRAEIEAVARQKVKEYVADLDVAGVVNAHLRAAAMGHLRHIVETEIKNARTIVDKHVRETVRTFFHPATLQRAFGAYAEIILHRAIQLRTADDAQARALKTIWDQGVKP